jgi:hypothetical protein
MDKRGGVAIQKSTDWFTDARRRSGKYASIRAGLATNWGSELERAARAPLAITGSKLLTTNAAAASSSNREAPARESRFGRLRRG